MTKTFLVINSITLVFMLIFDVFYMISHGLLVKSIASIMFVTTGTVNFIYCIKNKSSLKFPIWMIVALVFAMLGDILLVLNFYLGALSFGIGHIFYFVSYCMLEKLNRRDFIYCIFISIFAISVILFAPFLDFGGDLMQTVCLAYAIIISFMVGKSISNLVKEKNRVNILIAIGSFLFIFSDCMLMLEMFGGISVASYLCLLTYYPAQFLLAFSLLVYGQISLTENKKVLFKD